MINRQKIEAIIDLLELQPHRYQSVGLLPYGIQKRVEWSTDNLYQYGKPIRRLKFPP